MNREMGEDERLGAGVWLRRAGTISWVLGIASLVAMGTGLFWAFELGAVALVPAGVLAGLGLVVGILARRLTRRRAAVRDGQGAVTGARISAVAVVVWTALSPLFSIWQYTWQDLQCYEYNVDQIGLCLLMYRYDHAERFPPAETWCDATLPLVRSPDTFRCPAAPDQRSGYALNVNLGALHAQSIGSPADVVLIFDGEGGWNAAGGAEAVAPRHRRGLFRAPNQWNAVFADGHRARITPGSSLSPRWKP